MHQLVQEDRVVSIEPKVSRTSHFHVAPTAPAVPVTSIPNSPKCSSHDDISTRSNEPKPKPNESGKEPSASVIKSPPTKKSKLYVSRSKDSGAVKDILKEKNKKEGNRRSNRNISSYLL